MGIPSLSYAQDEDAVCERAYVEGQRRGDYEEVGKHLATCRDTCPDIMVADCKRWRLELETRQPAISFKAVNGRGEPVEDVRVWIDGSLREHALPTGKLRVAPGERRIRIERDGAAAYEETVRIAEGQTRDVVAVLPAIVSPGTVPSAVWVLGGVGLAAVFIGGVVLVAGQAKRGDLADSCAPACDPAEGDAVVRLWTVGGVVAGVGGLLLGASVVLWATKTSEEPSTGEAPNTAWMSVGPNRLSLSGTF